MIQYTKAVQAKLYSLLTVLTSLLKYIEECFVSPAQRVPAAAQQVVPQESLPWKGL